MKVLMLGRSKLMKIGGGDKVQIVNTAKELEKLGVEVKIKTNLKFDPAKYDIIHVFQLDWIPETYFYIKKAHKARKPVVLSPIHHSVSEVKKFDDIFVFDFRRISKFLFKDQFKRDTFKNVYRCFSNPEIFIPTLISIFKGLKKMHKECLKMSKAVLVQTSLEAEDLKKTYGVAFNWHKVVNGVGKNFLNVENIKNPFDFDNYILCVGRIEPRKNQLSVIKAVERFRSENNLDIKLVFIGKIGNLKHFEYNKLFKEQTAKNDWVIHIDSVPYEKMPSYYKYAKVGVSASWFETTGLTSLEALYCGTNAVASGARAKEYLGEHASYCCPDDIESIKKAIQKEFFAPRPVLSGEIKEKYTWKRAAEKTLEVYNKILGK